jgi:hypothetical protein
MRRENMEPRDLLGIKINCKEYKKCNCEKIDRKR